VFEVKLGMGKHETDPSLMSNFGQIMQWTYYHSIIIVVGISLMKMSVGLFLFRLVQGTRYKRFIIAMLAFLVAFTFACVGTLVFQCWPIEAAWDFTVRPTSRCFSTDTFRSIGLFNGSINIATDVLFAVLPIPIIWGLRLNVRTKISLICILSLGFFACACSIVKEVYLSNFFTNPDFSFNDTYAIWNDVELAVGILAACLPALRPLFAFLLETAHTFKSSGLRSRTNVNRHHRYYIQHDDIKLDPLQDQHKNDVTVTSNGSSSANVGPYYENGIDVARNSSAASRGPMSKLEQNIGLADGGSEENILAVQNYSYGIPARGKGIVKTTEVHVTEKRGYV